MVHRDIELATYTKAKLHVPHVSSSKALDHIKKIKCTNKKITAEVTPITYTLMKRQYVILIRILK